MPERTDAAGGADAESEVISKASPLNWWFFTLLLLGGIILRLEYLREFSNEVHFAFPLGADISEYHDRAKEILAGKIFPATPNIHAPLYGFFLAFLYKIGGESIFAVRSIQLLLNFGAFVGFFFLLRRRQVSPAISWGFLIFAMFTPAAIFHQAELISETLLAPLLAIMFYFIQRNREKPSYKFVIASGTCGALLVLTHGLMLCFAAAWIAWNFFSGKRRDALIFGGTCLLILASVVTVKSIHYGRFTGIQDNTFFNLYLGSNPDADGGCFLRPGMQWKRVHAQAAAEAEAAGTTKEQIFLKRSILFYLKTPGRAAVLLCRKTIKLFSPVESIAGSDPNALIMATPLQRYGRVISSVVLVFFLCGLYFAIRKKQWQHIDLFLLTAALGAGQLICVTSGRYRQGMLPGIFLLAAIGAAHINWKKFSIPCVAAMIALAALHPTTGGEAEAASIRADAMFNLKRYDEAARYVRIAMKEIDHPARFCNLLGEIAAIKGDYPAAAKHYLDAINGEPDEAISYFNLGHLAFRSKNYPVAEKYLRITLQLDQQQPVAWNDLGLIAAQTGNLNTAEKCFHNAVSLAPDHEGYRKNLQIISNILRRTPGRR